MLESADVKTKIIVKPQGYPKQNISAVGLHCSLLLGKHQMHDFENAGYFILRSFLFLNKEPKRNNNKEQTTPQAMHSDCSQHKNARTA